MVEDEPAVAAALSQALQLLVDTHISVQHCETAEAAERLLAGREYDLLITDQRLPGMTGLELLAHAKRLRPQMPGILMTGYGTPEIEAAADALNCSYLTKPFGLARFVTVVRGALAGGDC